MKFSVFISCLVFTCAVQFSEQKKSEEPVNDAKLLEYLMEGYNRMARPGIPANNDVVTVELEVLLSRINCLKDDVLSTSGWLNMGWKDMRLSWNTSDFNGVETVQIPAKHLWLPDISLFNIASAENSQYVMVEQKALLFADGRVRYEPQIHLNSFCLEPRSYEVTNGTVSCELYFRCWFLGTQKLKIIRGPNHFPQMYMLPNRHLQLVDSRVREVEVTDDNITFSDIVVTLDLKKFF